MQESRFSAQINTQVIKLKEKENKRNPKAGPELLIHPVIIGSPETPRAVAAAKWSNQNVNKLHNSRPPPLSTHQHHHRSKSKHDLIPTSLLLQLEAGRNFETFIASTSGLKPFSSTQNDKMTHDIPGCQI